jgi:hypothetical protein
VPLRQHDFVLETRRCAAAAASNTYASLIALEKRAVAGGVNTNAQRPQFK